MAASSHDVFFSTSISIFLFNLFLEKNRVKVYIAKYDETEKQGINMAHRYVCIYIYDGSNQYLYGSFQYYC